MLKNLKIKTKVIMLTIVLLAFVLVMGLVGLNGLSSVYESASIAREDLDPSIELLLNIDRDAQQGLVALRSELLSGNAEWQKQQEADYLENIKQVSDRWEEYKKIGQPLAGEGEHREKFEANFELWKKSAASIHNLIIEGTPEGLNRAKAKLIEDGKQFEAMRDQIDELTTIYETEIKKNAEDQTETNESTHLMLRSAMVLAILVGAVLAIVMIRSILKPINQLNETLEDLVKGEGDLTKRLLINNEDELGQASGLVNQFLQKLHETITQITFALEEVANTGENLSTTASEASVATSQVTRAIQEVAKGSAEQTSYINDTVSNVQESRNAISKVASGAEEQASAIVQTVDMVSQMSNSIQEVAANAHTVAKAAEQTQEAATKGQKAVVTTISGMDGIKEKVEETAVKVRDLGERSEQIGEIIQVIDDIAEQTNLLALNAAIEAARAGEHGKGFAVVADQVRKLAERSGKATKQITDLITNIQSLTNGAVLAMEQGTEEVAHGVELARGAGSALEEILATAQDTFQQATMISAAAEEIADKSIEVGKSIDRVHIITEENNSEMQILNNVIEQVSDAMEGVAAITEESAAASEEVSASSEEVAASVQEMENAALRLFAMAEEVTTVVRRFKV